MRTWNVWRPLLGLLFVLLLTGCASSVFRQPEVTLENARIAGIGLRGGSLVVTLLVTNPNRFALHANELRYRLSVREPSQTGRDTTWLDFAQGSHPERFTVRSGETARVQIPVEFEYSGLGSAASSLLERGTFTYRAGGEVDVRTPLGTHTIPFQKSGTMSLTGSP